MVEITNQQKAHQPEPVSNLREYFQEEWDAMMDKMLAEGGRKQAAKESISTSRKNYEGLNKTLTLICTLAQAAHDFRQLSPKCHIVTFHHIGEYMALYLGISRDTFSEHCKTLKQLGLIDFKGQTATTKKYGNIASGTVFCVSLRGQRGVKLAYHDLKEQHRDMNGDIRAGRTFYKIRQSLNTSNSKAVLKDLKDWLYITIKQQALLTVGSCAKLQKAMQDTFERTTLFNMKGDDLDLFLFKLDLLCSHPTQQNITDVAKQFASAFNDHHSLGFWVNTLRSLTRANLAQNNLIEFFKSLVKRFLDEFKDGIPKKPMGFFVTMLKQSGLWDQLRAT